MTSATSEVTSHPRDPEDNNSQVKRRTLQKKSTAAIAAARSKDVTRRMICGGLAGMIAKVRPKHEQI